MRLTAEEIKLIAFIALALLVGAGVKHYRDTHPRTLPAQPTPKYVVPK